MQFNDLASMEKALVNQIMSAVGHNDGLRHIIAQAEAKKVDSEVYAKYPNPTSYRRRLKGGLGDPDNVERTAIDTDGKNIKLIYENTTEGVDNLRGESLTDVIEEGIVDAWSNPNGVWSDPRPFIEPTVEELLGNNQLRSGLVTILKDSGLNVK